MAAYAVTSCRFERLTVKAPGFSGGYLLAIHRWGRIGTYSSGIPAQLRRERLREKYRAGFGLFVGAYLIEGNASKAAVEAGYAKKTAGQQAAENLKNPQILALIERQLSRGQQRGDDVNNVTPA